MDIKQLRYFATVASTSSIRSAAGLLGIAPASLSKAIKRLEEEIGLELVVASGRGIMITSEGRQFADLASELLAQHETFLVGYDRLRAEVSPTVVRIALHEVFGTYCIGELLDTCLAGRRVVTRTTRPGHVEQAVANGSADYGMTYAACPTMGIEHTHLGSLSMVIAGRAERFGDVPLDELPFVAPVEPIGVPLGLLRQADGWPDSTPRLVHHRVSDLESALELCRRGQGVVWLPAFLVRMHNQFALEERTLAALQPDGVPDAHLELHFVRSVGRGDDALVYEMTTELRRLVCDPEPGAGPEA